MSAKTELVRNAAGRLVPAVVNGKEQAFITKAKYACACGPGCDCGTISQKPGNCACGKPMKKI